MLSTCTVQPWRLKKYISCIVTSGSVQCPLSNVSRYTLDKGYCLCLMSKHLYNFKGQHEIANLGQGSLFCCYPLWPLAFMWSTSTEGWVAVSPLCNVCVSNVIIFVTDIIILSINVFTFRWMCVAVHLQFQFCCVSFSKPSLFSHPYVRNFEVRTLFIVTISWVTKWPAIHMFLFSEEINLIAEWKRNVNTKL